MRHRSLKLLNISLFLASPLLSQVSATVRDADGQVWAGGSYTVQMTSPNGTPTIAGVPQSAIRLAGQLSATGTLSIPLVPSASFDQGNVRYNFTLLPNATYDGPVRIDGITITSATQDISAILSARLAPPRFYPGPGTYGYSDLEASKGPYSAGVSYTNVVLSATRQWNGSAWTTLGGTGSGGTVDTTARASADNAVALATAANNALTTKLDSSFFTGAQTTYVRGDGTIVPFPAGAAGSGTINAGTAKALAIYPANGTAVSAAPGITVDTTGSYLTAQAMQGIGSANGYAPNNTVQGFQAAFAAGFPVVTRGYGYQGANDDPCPTHTAGLGQDYTSYYYTSWLGVKECYVGAGVTRTFHTPLSLAGGSGDLSAETNYLNNTGYGRNYGNGPGSGNNLWRVSHGPIWHGYASAPGIFEMGSTYANKTGTGDFILGRKYQNYSGGNEDASGEGVEADHIEQDENPSYVAQISGNPAKGATVVLTTGGNGCGVDGGSCSGAGRILMRVASPTYAGAVTAVTGASITAPGTMTTAFAMTPSPAFGTTTDIPDSSDPNVGAATFADGSAAQITVTMLGGTNGTGSAFRAAGGACISAGSQWESTDYTSAAASGGKQVLSLLHHKGPLQGGAVKVYDGDCHYLSVPVDGGLYNRTAYIVYGITDAHTLEWGSQDAGARGSGPLGSADNFRLPTPAVMNLGLNRDASGKIVFLPGTGTGAFQYAGLTPTVSGCSDASFNGTATGPLIQAVDGSSVNFATSTQSAGFCPNGSLSFQGYNSIIVTEGARVESNVNPAKPYTSSAIIDTRVDGTLTMDHNEAAWVSGETVEEALDANVRARGHFENAIKTSPQSGYGSAWFPTRLQGYDLWANPQFFGNLPDYIGFGGWKSLPTLLRADGSIPEQYAVDSLYQPVGGFLHVRGNSGCLPGSAVCPSYFLWDHNGRGLAYNDYTKTLTLDGQQHLALHDATVQVMSSQIFNAQSASGFQTSGSQFTGLGSGLALIEAGAYYDGTEHYMPGSTAATRILMDGSQMILQSASGGTFPGWTTVSSTSAAGDSMVRHLSGGVVVPSVAAGPQATSCTVTGTDVAFRLSCTTGAAPASGVLATVTFGAPFPATAVNPSGIPHVTFGARDANGAVSSNNIFTTPTTTNVTINAVNAPIANGVSTWDFVVVQ